MTVIAWDGNILAADTLAQVGYTKEYVTKIGKFTRDSYSYLYGVSGDLDICLEVVEWLKNPNSNTFPESARDKDSPSCVLLIRNDNFISRYQRTPCPIITPKKYAAIGGGKDIALAIMSLGYSAVTAVETTIDFDIGCGGHVETLTFD